MESVRVSIPDLIEEYSTGNALPSRAVDRLSKFDSFILNGHSIARQQQRGLTRELIAFALLFGKRERAPQRGTPNACSYQLDRKCLPILKAWLGESFRKFQDCPDFFVVFDPIAKQVITVSHKTKRKIR